FSVRQFIGFTLTLLTLQATPTNGHAPYFLQPSCEHALFTRSLLSHWLEPRTHLIVIGQVLPPATRRFTEMDSNGTEYMDHFGSYAKRRRHDSEQSVLEYTDLEAAEALVCMSSWGQSHFLGSSRPNPCKPRPLTPASDSCDSLMPPELPEPPKDFVSLSSLCMTPPHSPSFVETSSPAVSSQHCSGLHQPVLAPIAEKTPSLPPQPQPCRAMATSVIRHTADSTPCQHHIPVAPDPKKTRHTVMAATLCQQHLITKTEQITTPPSPPAPLTPTLSASGMEQHASLSKLYLNSVSTPTPVNMQMRNGPPAPTTLSPPSIPSPQIICQMFPVSSQSGIISAFIPVFKRAILGFGPPPHQSSPSALQ
ncbi:Krueppel-like factor 11, partial [Dissostichus eleginoides]